MSTGIVVDSPQIQVDVSLTASVPMDQAIVLSETSLRAGYKTLVKFVAETVVVSRSATDPFWWLYAEGARYLSDGSLSTKTLGDAQYRLEEAPAGLRAFALQAMAQVGLR